MQKLADLRQALLASGLNIQPEDLTVRVKSGTVRSHYEHPDQTTNHNMRLEYSAEVLIAEYHGAPSAACWLVAKWLHNAQPGHKPDALKFEADILDDERADLLITVSGLTDIYHVHDAADGIHLDACTPPHIDRKVYP